MARTGKSFIEERHASILELVNAHGRVTVRDLCDRLSVSVATVRNDLGTLERLGKIRRTHGGALAVSPGSPTLPFGTRRLLHGAAKRAIGRAAADLIQEGEVVFVDGGTTAAEMRAYLAEMHRITVITPSIEVIYWLGATSPIEVYVLNGFLKRDSLSSIGVPAEESIRQMNIAKAFCGAAGFTLGEGLTDNHPGFVEQKRVICRHARTVVGLVDHSKIGVTSLASFAGIDDLDVIVTDRPLPETIAEALRERGIQVVLARAEDPQGDPSRRSPGRSRR